MRASLNRRCGWLTVLAGLLAGCASAPTPSSSRTAAAAVQLNRSGQVAWQHGEYRQAQAAFETALAIDMAAEQTDGIAINLLNLARLDQLQGHLPAAHQRLAMLLAQPAAAAPHWQIAAAIRQAQLYQVEGKLQQAGHWAQQAGRWCRMDCEERATLLNMQADMALRRQDYAAAAAAAERALAQSRSSRQRNEQANALRLLGEVAMRQQHAAAAQPLLVQALALDKALGLPARIHRDLMLLGQAASQSGQPSQAKAYFQRARQVGQGMARMPAALKVGT